MKRLVILFIVILVAFFGGVLLVGDIVVQPFQTSVAPPPAELGAKSVVFPSSSGTMLHGWLAAGTPGDGVVVLLHGVRANRHAMLERALVLHRKGFGVLLFDFQAHGESIGRHITFGYLEGLDAESAVHYARQVLPGERIGIIGLSLGGAAAILAPKPLQVQAIVLESVYSTIHLAFTNRLRAHLDRIAGAILVPLISPPFEWLMPIVIGVGPGDL
jgi:pimeloyl-ACP methyl ester carboxylesterase